MVACSFGFIVVRVSCEGFYIFELSGFFLLVFPVIVCLLFVWVFFVSLCVGVGISFFLCRRVLWRHLVR